MIKLCACLRAQPGFISPNDQSPSLLSGTQLGRRCRSLSSHLCNSADPPPVPARSAHAALPWMVELAARRYSDRDLVKGLILNTVSPSLSDGRLPQSLSVTICGAGGDRAAAYPRAWHAGD